MTVAERIFAALSAAATSSDGLRAYPNEFPQLATFPLIVYTIVGGEDDVHLGGASDSAHRLIQLDAWGRTAIGVEELMSVARYKMLAASTFSVGAINVSGAASYEPDTKLFRASREFSIHLEL
jgi:hypothetical protein